MSDLSVLAIAFKLQGFEAALKARQFDPGNVGLQVGAVSLILYPAFLLTSMFVV